MSFWIAILIALIVSAIGFKKYIWFISLGYGFSIAALGIAFLIGFAPTLNALDVVLCALFIIYGLRLGIYLAVREAKSSSYQKALNKETKSNDQVTVPVRLAIWIAAALLYSFMVAPVFYRMQSGAAPDAVGIVGAVLMVIGIVLEASADLQKQRAKKKNPHRFVSSGLFGFVRCPNYLGELITWTGVLVSGFGVLSGVLQWAIAIIGWLGIVYVMFSGARRLEVRQNRNYGANPEYQRYVSTVPIILPFVHLYSVEKYTWLVA